MATEGLIDSDEEIIDKLIECIGVLLQYPGIEINSEDMKGEATPLFYAASAGNEKAVDLLLAFGAAAAVTTTQERQSVMSSGRTYQTLILSSSTRHAKVVQSRTSYSTS